MTLCCTEAFLTSAPRQQQYLSTCFPTQFTLRFVWFLYFDAAYMLHHSILLLHARVSFIVCYARVVLLELAMVSAI